jgi:ribosomal protein S18 acetylase RimI-like enzyme
MTVAKLIPMTVNEFQHFYTWIVGDYAQQQVRVGTWRAEKALELSRKMMDDLLPNGQDSAGQFLYVIRNQEGTLIGYLWYGLRDEGQIQAAVLYDLVIFEEFRRQGYATQAMFALEEKVREQGLTQILLHVYGHNDSARALYQKVGYRERNITMAKNLIAQS